nr:hypothetical protein CJLB15_00085 [Campylobacter phage CJLB-15]
MDLLIKYNYCGSLTDLCMTTKRYSIDIMGISFQRKKKKKC